MRVEQEQPRQLLDKSSISYVQFIHALSSEHTKVSYTYFLDSFLRFSNMSCDQLLELEPRKAQGLIISYIVDMKEKQKQSPNTMKVKVSAVKTFFVMNDYTEINWEKIRKYIGEFYRVAEDRPYTREEIKLLVDSARSLRDKAIILLMASSGMRRGALPNLRLKHLRKINKYNIFVIDVYKQAREHYYTFCTPECRQAIETYLEWRARLGEKLSPESPLFRKDFDTRFGASAKKIIPISRGAIVQMLNGLRNSTNVIQRQALTENIKSGSHRSKIAAAHGFRKFFDTTCTSNGMETLFVELVMGHDTGLKEVYFKPKMNEVLEGNDRMNGYISVIDDLTINPENRLRRQVEILTIDSDKFARLEAEMNKLKELVNS